jgi:hypothetical protein
MMSAPFRQQIDKEGSVLFVIEFRYGLAAHNLESVVCSAFIRSEGGDCQAAVHGMIGA